MTYKIIILIFFVILLIIINYNILEKLQIKEGFDVNFGKMNIVLGESGILINDAEITPQNKIKFILSNGKTLETKKSIKGNIGTKGDDAIYITGKQIKDGNLTFNFSDGTKKLIGKIKGESVAAGTTALDGDRGEKSKRIPKKYNKNDKAKTEVQDNGKIRLFLENDTYIESDNSTKGESGKMPENVDPSTIAYINPITKIENEADYKKRTCQLWYSEAGNTKYLKIYELFIGNTDSTDISNTKFNEMDEVIWNSKKPENYFDLVYENPKTLNGKFSDIINYIVLIDGNLKSKIKIVNFQRNVLSGQIPINLGKFINITNLQLQNNNLSGTIPDKLSDLVHLIEFNISSNNNITGLIPNTFIKLTKLQKINTKLTGLSDKHKVKFDTLDAAQQFLKTLDELTYNGVKLGKGLLTLFRGINSDFFNGNSTKIKSKLNLNKELIELGLEITEVPQNMLNDKSLSWNDLKQESIIAIFSRIQMKYFHNDVSYFSSVFESSILTNVFAPYMGAFRNMSIEGNIATLLSVINEHGLNEKIKFINMSYNNLGGSIPDSITKLTNLTYLNLSHNQDITGQLPDGFGDMTNLKFLLLNNTGISGILPESLKTLQNLVMINTKDTKLHYAYQKVKIPESYSYQEITNYNNLSAQKKEIKEFLKTNIAYDDYQVCKTNVILCNNNNVVNKKIELTDPNAEFVLVSDSDQVIVTNEDGTAVDGEWVQFPSSQSGFEEEDLGVVPANDEYGNIIPSTDTIFNELSPKDNLKLYTYQSPKNDTSLSYIRKINLGRMFGLHISNLGKMRYSYSMNTYLTINHKLKLSNFISNNKFKLKKYKYSQFKDYDNIPIDISLNNLKFKYSSGYRNFSIQKTSGGGFEGASNLKTQQFTFPNFDINLSIKSNYKFKNIPESFFNKYYFKTNKINSIINIQSSFGDKIYLITDTSTLSKINLNNTPLNNKISKANIQYNLGLSFKDQFTEYSGYGPEMQGRFEKFDIKFWRPIHTSFNELSGKEITSSDLQLLRNDSPSQSPPTWNIHVPASDRPLTGPIPIKEANIQVEINNKSDLISKLNNSGYDLTKTHNIYEI